MDEFEKQAGMMELGQSPEQSPSVVSSWPTQVSSDYACDKADGGPSSRDQSEGMIRAQWRPWVPIRSLFSTRRQQEATATDSNAQNQHSSDVESCSESQSGHAPEMPLKVRSLKEFETGYPNFATFADSDESFGLYRRFGYLQARLLLEKQDELRCLEDQLDKLDHSEENSDPDNLFSRECQGDTRRGLLGQIQAQFVEYSQLLIVAQQLRAFNRPSKSEHRSVRNYIHNAGPIDPEESNFIHWKEDLVTLRPGREYAWLDRTIEAGLRRTPRPFKGLSEWIFRSKELREKASDKSQVYYSRDRIEACSSIIITIEIGFMLVLPIYLLYHLVEHNDGQMTPKANAIYMGILLIFTLAFAAIMSYFTKARRHEVLGAAAAYCAVLVVFLGNLGNTAAS